jgi:hypothetical protein
VAYGAIGALDLEPLREVLLDNHVLASSARMFQLPQVVT